MSPTLLLNSPGSVKAEMSTAMKKWPTLTPVTALRKAPPWRAEERTSTTAE
jgi:hypothetical protein